MEQVYIWFFGKVIILYIRVLDFCSLCFTLYWSSIFFSIARLKATSQEAESVRREQTMWERKLGELQARCTTLEEEKYEALAKVRESVQVAEEATLQKDQVTAVALSLSLPLLFYSFPILLGRPSILLSLLSSIILWQVSTSLQHSRTIELPTEMCICVCL